MPLSGTTKEESVHPAETRDLERAFSSSPPWIEAVDHVLAAWRRVLLWTAAALAISAALGFFFSKYLATTQIMPPDSSSGSGLASLLPMFARSSSAPSLPGIAGDLLGIKTTGGLFTKVMQSETVQDRMIDRFDLLRRYHTRRRFSARERLASRTTISEDKKSGVVTVNVKDYDPAVAQQMANAYVEELNQVMVRVSTSAARREREFIEQRLAEEKKSLDDAEQRFSRFASNSMALDVPQQTRVMVESAARLQGELIAARAELQSLEQVYALENPRVRSLRARIAELQRELGRLNTGAGIADSSNPYPAVSKLPSLGVEWTDLYRETKIHETVFEMLTQQYESARIQEAKETPTAKVLDYATVPERRTPPWTLVIGLGTLAGMLLAIAGLTLQWWWGRLPDVAGPRLLWNTILRRPRSLAWK